MKRIEFLNQLKAQLWALPEADIQCSLDYYSEMIDDRMEDGLSEEEAVAAIGDLEEIVKQILTETPRPPQTVKPEQKTARKRKTTWWEILLLVLGFPVWGSLLIAVAAVGFSLWISLWSVVIALYATAFALAVCAIGLPVAAFSLLWIHRYGECAVLAGSALICAGCAILVFLLSNLAAKGLVALTKWICGGIFRRKERTA